MTEVDVAIIGAGAAGLAAASALATAPLNVVVLEAQDRIGGRAHTVSRAGLPLDLGCEWLHSADRNPLVAAIAASGLTIDKTPPPWANPEATVNFGAAERQAYGDAFAAFDERVEAAAREPADRPASDLLEPGGRWNPLLNAFSAYYNGAEFDQVSVKDYAAYDDSEVNWRVAEGYGAAIAGLARLASGSSATVRSACCATTDRVWRWRRPGGWSRRGRPSSASPRPCWPPGRCGSCPNCPASWRPPKACRWVSPTRCS
jgi:monoamine oxidase